MLRISNVIPRRLPAYGGALVRITGRGFSRETEVLFDGIPAAQVFRVDESMLMAEMPLLAPSVGERSLTVRDAGLEATFPGRERRSKREAG